MSRVLPIVLSSVCLALACSPAPPGPWTVASTEAIVADHVVAADLDGDGVVELGTVRGGTLEIGGHSIDLPGAFQRAVRLDKSGGDTLVVASGQGRGHREAPAVLTQLTADGHQQVWTYQGDRNQVTDLRAVNGRIWLTAYTDARKVGGGWLDDGAFDPLTVSHMGQRQLPLADGRVVVARVYGEAPKSPGDLQLHTPGQPASPLASLRGARALAAVDLDGDGVDEVISGDGWHFAYGREGDPRVVVHSGPELAESRVIGWVPGSYAALDILPIGTGLQAALLVQGSRRVVLLQRDALGWGVLDLGEISEVGDVAVYEAEDGLKVAISGDGARVLTLQRAP